MKSKLCLVCQTEFFRTRSYGKKQWDSKIHCSRQCRGKSARIGSEKPCNHCGDLMWIQPYQMSGEKEKKYCSQTCRSQGRNWKPTEESKAKQSKALKGKKKNYQVASGEKHWNWKGGVTSHDRNERLRFRREMQKLVFERDNYTCVICEQQGNVQVDHIKKWSDYPELRFDIDNCRTLCMACHYYVTFKRKLPKGVVWGHNLSRRVVS